MNCIIIEDQPPAQRILKKFTADIGSLHIKGVFPDAIQAMEFLKVEQVDLIFLDIHLPKISGLDFLKSLSHPPNVILTTAFPDYALESYDLNVVDYLLKPFSFQRFVKAVAKVPAKQAPAQSQQEESKSQELFIKSGYEHIKISVDDIQYIKSDADYTELYFATKKHLSTESLRYWMETLSESQFVRIHKSYIINASKITKISSTQIYLEGGIIVPIGRRYKEALNQRFLS